MHLSYSLPCNQSSTFARIPFCPKRDLAPFKRPVERIFSKNTESFSGNSLLSIRSIPGPDTPKHQDTHLEPLRNERFVENRWRNVSFQGFSEDSSSRKKWTTFALDHLPAIDPSDRMTKRMSANWCWEWKSFLRTAQVPRPYELVLKRKGYPTFSGRTSKGKQARRSRPAGPESEKVKRKKAGGARQIVQRTPEQESSCYLSGQNSPPVMILGRGSYGISSAHNPEQDDDNRNHQKNVNKTSHCIRGNDSKKPKNDQYNSNCIKHGEQPC